MEDLINEDEFIAKKGDYNPWKKSFFRHYIYAVLQVLLMLALSHIIDYNVVIDSLFFLLVPFITVVRMFYHNRKNFDLPPVIKLFGIAGMLAVYLFTTILINFSAFFDGIRFTRSFLEEIIVLLLVWFIYFVTASAIVFMISGRRNKKN